ncbi:MAG TPA: LCP family protein [Candidatus Dormibacteraeota bacterium]
MLLLMLLAGTVAGVRLAGFLGSVVNLQDPLAAVQKQVEPPAGSILYKLSHGQRVNLLLLGYGGDENDAPYLTDSMMVVAIDPSSHRAMEVSVPRDLVVSIDAFRSHPPALEKINAAYEIGMDDASWPAKRPEYEGRKAGGRLAMDTVGRVTGLQFDGFLAMDFKGFRDLVSALGGVQVCLDQRLDDNLYPDYHDGYIKGGIHFPAGCQTVDGEQALQLARSRHAIQPEQASDYGRARRQQLLLSAIRSKASSLDAVSRAPQLLDALQKNFVTSLDLPDMQALYRWGAHLSDGSIGHFGISEADLLDAFQFRKGTCGDPGVWVLCPIDPSFGAVKAFFAALFVDPKVLAEAAPVEVANASATLDDLGSRVTNVLRPLGFQVADPIRRRTQERSTVYDFSGGRYPETARWMAAYFGANVVTVTPATPAPAGAPPGTGGVVVLLGRDYALHWIGQA